MAANQTVNVYGIIPDKFSLQAPSSKKKEVYGLTFPLGLEKNNGGFFKKNSGINLIRQSVKQLLLTEKGERLMLPNYGCNLRKFLFQPLDENTFTAIKEEIRNSFSNYIVGAKIVKLAVFPTGDTGPAGGNSMQVILTLELDADELRVFDVEVNIG
jgi:phage baseplate assembly protein W